METKLSYATLDVFTDARFTGNQLAIVNLPKQVSIAQAQKQAIAREFNYSETVFLHEDVGAEEGREVDIFTIYDEIPFAGHPTIGTLCYIGMTLKGSGLHHLKLLAKAGAINATYDHGTKMARAEIPHHVHIHATTVGPAAVIESQPQLESTMNTSKGSPELSKFPVVSIVKGMTFILVGLSDLPGGLEKVQTSPIRIPYEGLDQAWSPSLVGAYYYVVLPTSDSSATKIRARMIEADIGEDPATGSAASALSSYLALEAGGASMTYQYEIEQGVEMGRRSVIGVHVTLDASGKRVEKVVLEGTSVKAMEGAIEV